MNQLYVSQSSPSSLVLVLWLENSNLGFIAESMKHLLNIRDTQVIFNSLGSFAESIPHRAYVKVKVFKGYDALSLLSSGSFSGFVPTQTSPDGFVCFKKVQFWNTAGVRKTAKEIEKYFNIEGLTLIEQTPYETAKTVCALNSSQVFGKSSSLSTIASSSGIASL